MWKFLLEDHAYLNGVDTLQKMRLIKTHYLYYHTMVSNEKEEVSSTESAGTLGISCASPLRSQQIAMLM